MKKKKTSEIRQLKRPSLKRMLLRNGIRGILLVVILGLVATGVFLTWRLDVEYDNCCDVSGNIHGNLSDYETKYYQDITRSKNAYYSYRGELLWNMKNISFYEQSPYRDFAAAIVEKEGDDYVISYDSRKMVGAKFRTDLYDGFLSFSSFDDNDNQREVKKLIESSEYMIEMETCYICRTDSTKYQPGIINIYEKYENSDSKPYKTLDCTPKDVSGYQQLDLKKGVWRTGIQNLIVGSEKNSRSMASIEMNLSEYLKDASFLLDEDGRYPLGDGICYEELHYFKESKLVNTLPFILIMGENTTLSDIEEKSGETTEEKGLIPLDNDFVRYNQSNPEIKVAYVVTEQRFCLWDIYKEVILTAWLIGIVFTLLLAFFIGYHQFRSQSMRWEKEQYRITLMNTMAHDLKSPLMVLSGYAENLKGLLAGSEEKQQHYVDSIMENVQYMNAMIGDIIELSKLEQTQEDGEKEEVELSVLVQGTIDRYQDILSSKQIGVDITGEAVKRVEKRAMLRVIDNIISNAVYYTPDGEKIIIVMNDDFLEVRNTGVTVSEEFCHNAFLPFVKGDDARGNEQGNGLGLAIVKELLKQLGMSCQMQTGDNEVRVVVKFHRK